MKSIKIKKGTIMICDSDENYKVVFVGLNKKLKNHFMGVIIAKGTTNNVVGDYYEQFGFHSFKPQ